MEILLEFLTPGVLWVVFLLVAVFITLVGIMLSYHWKEYSTDAHKSGKFFRLYIFITALFLGIMAISIMLYGYGS